MHCSGTHVESGYLVQLGICMYRASFIPASSDGCVRVLARCLQQSPSYLDSRAALISHSLDGAPRVTERTTSGKTLFVKEQLGFSA